MANLERKRCADGHENHDFDTATASMLKLSSDSKGYGVKNSYVLRSRFGLLNLTIQYAWCQKGRSILTEILLKIQYKWVPYIPDTLITRPIYSCLFYRPIYITNANTGWSRKITIETI